MNNSDQSLIKFPCHFPIKAMGVAEDDFDALVVTLVRKHVDDLSEGAIKTQPSSKGNYISVTVTVFAQNQAQLDAIYRELTSHERVLMTF